MDVNVPNVRKHVTNNTIGQRIAKNVRNVVKQGRTNTNGTTIRNANVIIVSRPMMSATTGEVIAKDV
jgi:hypothetical protein